MNGVSELMQLHDQLYGEYIDHRSEILERHPDFPERAEALVSEMERISAEVTDAADYDWLRSAADKWRGVFTYVLKVPRDVVLSVPREPLKRAVKEQLMMWADHDLDYWVRHRAYELAKERAVRKFQTLSPAEMLRRVPSTDEESKADWALANVHLACEILEGRIALRQIRSASYGRLENCWLDDVKRLKANQIWLEKGADPDSEGSLGNYYDACLELDKVLQGAGGRRPAAEFEPVREYLLTRGIAGPAPNAISRHELIARKARRIWEITGGEAEANWKAGEAYVSAFYDNIIPAVADADVNAVRAVSEAVVAGSLSGRELAINTFEAVIVAAFVGAGADAELAASA